MARASARARAITNTTAACTNTAPKLPEVSASAKSGSDTATTGWSRPRASPGSNPAAMAATAAPWLAARSIGAARGGAISPQAR